MNLSAHNTNIDGHIRARCFLQTFFDTLRYKTVKMTITV